jgi:hypothetical protein
MEIFKRMLPLITKGRGEKALSAYVWTLLQTFETYANDLAVFRYPRPSLLQTRTSPGLQRLAPRPVGHEVSGSSSGRGPLFRPTRR